ncbi:response regulator [Sphingomonas sp. CFBP 13603]|uniref:response regulator n=1 Tax=Sphingomonas sp. CFBP 13603 TaxID=2774040 RepID=UPI001866729D|nr:response regulator [Sphingomonas sp. CFBP 13603]MBE2993407.1 response regulator [Sphingomonas sp. CFBP 13603]
MTKTALIVEDEIFVALDLERILMDAGYGVAGIAADRDSAIAAAPGCNFAFVDINLRDGPTGPEIAKRMAQDYGVKVVFVTANPAQIGDAERLGYIRKPFSDAAILAAAALACNDDPIAHDDVIRVVSG